ncbi:MAG TPA: Holliday junction resolvase RuvX [Candidatus Polarisedimenticolia bacterium]|nr:Holliday junction resolvase RuvX [Candidatus Polarisedimenticolia bacterium]
MDRILALDVGEATLGVAVSDSLGLTAQPITTIHRSGMKEDLRAISRLIEEHAATTILVGMPLRMSGEAGTAAAEVEVFVGKLRTRLALPVITWDERLSTVQAERALLEADLSRRKRREVINQVAAAIILQSYLDSRPRADG